MRKILLLALFLISSYSYGQFWIDVALKGGAGPNLLLNTNVFEDNDLIHKFGMGTMIGGKAGFNFGDIHSINIDVSTISFNQTFQNKADRLLQEDLAFKSTDFSLLYRKLFEGRYLEFGGVMCKIKDETYLNDTNYGAVFGFGRTLAGSDRVAINLGAKFRYIFNDILVDEPGAESIFYGTSYPVYKKSTPLTAFITLELEWAVGVFRRSSCYRNRLRFITF